MKSDPVTYHHLEDEEFVYDVLRMVSVRCKNPHPRLVGKPCNAMLKIGATGGQVSVDCWRCYGTIHLNFDESGTDVRQKEQVAVS